MTDPSAGVAPLSFDYVLLPLDGSAFAAAALPTARALATRFRARLVSVSVAPDDRDAALLRTHAIDTLGDAGADVVIGEDAAQVIVARAGELGSCLVCMSTRGRGRIAGTVLGSVARAVLVDSASPVVAVGPQADRPDALVGRPRRRPANWPEPLSVGGIVACVDGSAESETVLPIAVRWALSLEIGLSILTVADDAAPTSAAEIHNRYGPADAKGYVDQLAHRWRDVAADVAGEVIYDPIGVASGLRSHLAAQPAALVAVTTHARSGFDRIRLGATAADIVRTSPVPALVVPLANP